MKKLFFLITIAIVYFSDCQSQDIIIMRNGNKIECHITKEDSMNVYFSTMVRENEVNTYLPRVEIEKIIYEKDKTQISSSDVILVEKSGLGYQYSLNGKILNLNELSNLLQSNNQARIKLDEAKNTSRMANILAFAGGALIGYPVGVALRGGKPNWVLAGIGTGLVILTIPIVQSAEKQCKEAVDIYNNGIRKSSMIKKELKFVFTSNGMGLCMRF